jgi:tRNA(Leu) C34 or U34 (ribose-2'-O)-methylase TrmL
MGYYEEVYLKRLNRYGMDYNSRVQNQREKEFEHYLLKVTTRVDIEYDHKTIPASFERYKQDETETLAYLLTRRATEIPSGTILMIPTQKGVKRPWMVYWLEEIQASGYNKYIMLKMSHFLEWTDRQGAKQTSWAYMYGQEDNMLKDELRSRSRSDTLYTEALKMSFFVMPTNEFIRKDDYLTVGEGALKEAYRVTGYDIQSTLGVEYVTVDPVYLRDETPAPEQTPEDSNEDFFWLNGGVSE